AARARQRASLSPPPPPPPPRPAGEAMADVELGVAVVELRIEGIEQAEMGVVRALAEGRAEIVLRVAVGVAGRERGAGRADGARVEPQDDRVVARDAAVGPPVQV